MKQSTVVVVGKSIGGDGRYIGGVGKIIFVDLGDTDVNLGKSVIVVGVYVGLGDNGGNLVKGITGIIGLVGKGGENVLILITGLVINVGGLVNIGIMMGAGWMNL